MTARLWLTKRCVIAIPGIDLIEKAVDIGSCSGADIDKFKKFKLEACMRKKSRLR